MKKVIVIFLVLAIVVTVIALLVLQLEATEREKGFINDHTHFTRKNMKFIQRQKCKINDCTYIAALYQAQFYNSDGRYEESKLICLNYMKVDGEYQNYSIEIIDLGGMYHESKREEV